MKFTTSLLAMAATASGFGDMGAPMMGMSGI